jgi:hypothetical protein
MFKTFGLSSSRTVSGPFARFADPLFSNLSLFVTMVCISLFPIVSIRNSVDHTVLLWIGLLDGSLMLS